MLRGMTRPLLAGHKVCWEFSELINDFVESNADVVQLRVSLNDWSNGDEDGDELLGEAEVDGPVVHD